MVAKRKPKSADNVNRDARDKALRELVLSGFASWSGKKPAVRKNPVKLTPGPSIAELVREGRR